MFHYYRELNSWVLTPLWHGLEAPDYDRRLPGTLAYETDQMATGPYRSQLFLKSKTSHTKDLEIEMSSFLSEDDGVTSFLDTYRANLKQFAAVMTLDGMAPLLPRLFSFFVVFKAFFSYLLFALACRQKGQLLPNFNPGGSVQENSCDQWDDWPAACEFVCEQNWHDQLCLLPAVGSHWWLRCAILPFHFSLFIHYQTNNELQWHPHHQTNGLPWKSPFLPKVSHKRRRSPSSSDSSGTTQLKSRTPWQGLYTSFRFVFPLCPPLFRPSNSLPCRVYRSKREWSTVTSRWQRTMRLTLRGSFCSLPTEPLIPRKNTALRLPRKTHFAHCLSRDLVVELNHLLPALERWRTMSLSTCLSFTNPHGGRRRSFRVMRGTRCSQRRSHSPNTSPLLLGFPTTESHTSMALWASLPHNSIVKVKSNPSFLLDPSNWQRVLHWCWQAWSCSVQTR